MNVLIRFKGDNDFGNVLLAFGGLLLPRVQGTPEILTPNIIADWFNTIAFTLHVMTRTHTSLDPKSDRSIFLQGYLRITPEDVYIDSAADDQMARATKWANYDAVMVDGSVCAQERVYLV
jgi:hypothetical protein